MKRGALLMRRLENVRGEFNLTALAYNINVVPVPGMISALTA